MTWLYVPSACAAASEGSILGSTSEPREPDWEDLARCAWSRGKRSPSQHWRRKWSAAPWMRRLSGLTCEPSTLARGVESWIASLADTHASHSHPPASAVGSRTPVTYGQMSLAFCENADPQSAFLRTSPVICRSEHTKSSASFKRWATALRAHCGRRRKLGHPIDESGCSSWDCANAASFPTPKASDSKRAASPGERARKSPCLPAAVMMLPTPTASDYGTQNGIGQKARPSLGTMARRNLWPTPVVGTHQQGDGLYEGKWLSLGAAARLWPTPTASEWKKVDCDLERGRVTPGLIVRVMEAERSASDEATGGKLNPTWVEWLMGFPLGWTASALSETPLSLSRLHEHSSSSTAPLHRIDCDMDEDCTCSAASADAATKEE